MKKIYLIFSLVLLSCLLLACSAEDPAIYYDGTGDIDDSDNYHSGDYSQPVRVIYSRIHMYELDRGPYYPMKVEVKIEGMSDSEYKEIGTLYNYRSNNNNDTNKIKIVLAHGYTYVYRFTIVNEESNVNGYIAYHSPTDKEDDNIMIFQHNNFKP